MGNHNLGCQENTLHQSEFFAPTPQERRQPQTTKCRNAIVNTNKQLTASVVKTALPKWYAFSGDPFVQDAIHGIDPKYRSTTQTKNQLSP